MFQEIKLILSDSKGIIDTVSKEIHDTYPASMVRALNEFRLQVNAAITKLIEEPDGSSAIMEEDEGDDSDNDEEDVEVSPKKRKRSLVVM